MHRSNVLKLGLLVGCLGGMVAMGKAQVPTPVSVLGHTPGDDFYLADYEDAVRYFHAAAAATRPDEDVFDGEDDGGARD